MIVSEKCVEAVKHMEKIDRMNEAIADFVTKKVESLNVNNVNHNELAAIANLARAVNGAPRQLTLSPFTPIESRLEEAPKKKSVRWPGVIPKL